MKKFYLLVFVLFGFIAAADGQVITAAEYFFDIDPGAGHGTAISFSANASISLPNVQIDAAGLANGYHFLYTRVKQSNAIWGHYRRQRFYVFDNSPVKAVQNVLTTAEYWIDAAPVTGTGKLIALTPADTVFYNDLIPGLQLDTGLHILSIRVKDSLGKWSAAKSDSIRIAAAVIPVTLNNFNANCAQNKVSLDWTVAAAQPDIKYFVIEKSIDSINWVTTGNGILPNNTPSQTTYNFAEIYNGFNYYRLQITGKDDKIIHTPAVKINCGSIPNGMQIYPVPADQFLNIIIQSDQTVSLDLIVIDITGRIIKRIRYNILNGKNSFIMYTRELASGPYVLKTISSLNFSNQKFIIIH